MPHETFENHQLSSSLCSLAIKEFGGVIIAQWLEGMRVEIQYTVWQREERIKRADGDHNPRTTGLVNKGRREDCEMRFEGAYIRALPETRYSSSRSATLSTLFAAHFASG